MTGRPDRSLPQITLMTADDDMPVYPRNPWRLAMTWADTGSAVPIPMKNHHHNGPIHPQPNSRTVIHEAIATRAYELWIDRGQPADQADNLWLEAEQALMTERSDPDQPAEITTGTD